MTNWNFEKVTTVASMFTYCQTIKEAIIPNLTLTVCITMATMFRYCYNLEKINFSNWSLPAMTTAPANFVSDCYALKDVIASNTANTQAILDKLCQQEIEALKAQNQQLQMQSYLASLAASQNAQTGQILTDNAAQTTALLRALNPAPIPAYVVANPNGCGCGNYFNGCGV